MRKIDISYLLFSTLVSCAPTTLTDLRTQAEIETSKLSALLHNIDTREELLHSLPKIKKNYYQIATLLLQVQSDDLVEDLGPSEASDRLFVELARLYEIPGCRDLLESAQTDAIQLLEKVN